VEGVHRRPRGPAPPPRPPTQTQRVAQRVQGPDRHVRAVPAEHRGLEQAAGRSGAARQIQEAQGVCERQVAAWLSCQDRYSDCARHFGQGLLPGL